MNKNYLITGITGFVGPSLADLLYENGHQVHGLIRRSSGMETDILDTVSQKCFNSIKFLYCNFEDYYSVTEVFHEHKFDGVFHLGAQSHPPTSFLDPLGTFKTNIIGTANIIQAIYKYQPSCKLMYCSTSEVYGDEGKHLAILQEHDELKPSNPYGISKAAIDLYMQERMNNGFIKGFTTRAFSHTGVRRGKNFSISSDAYQVARIMKGLQEPTLKVGNLNTERVVVDVRDIVRAYYLLMETSKSNGQVFNVCGDGPPQKMSYFTDTLIKLSGVKIKKEVDKRFWRPIDIQYQYGDTTKLKKLTGWEPKIPIEDTLRSLLNYWLKKIENE